MGFFGSFTLVLGTPAILVTAPVVPVPLAMRRYVNHVLVSRVILLAVAVGIALLSAALVRLASDVLIVLAFLGTFTIPGKFSIFTMRIWTFAHTVSTILHQPCYISLYITSAGPFLSLCLLQLPDLASHPVSNEASHTTMNCCSGKNVRCSIGGLLGEFCGILVCGCFCCLLEVGELFGPLVELFNSGDRRLPLDRMSSGNCWSVEENRLLVGMVPLTARCRGDSSLLCVSIYFFITISMCMYPFCEFVSRLG